MNTPYEQAVKALSEATGAHIDIGSDRIAMTEVEGRIVMLMPFGEKESGMTAFSVIAEDQEGKPLPRTVIDKALELNLFGFGTGGGHIGQFKGALIFSLSRQLERTEAEPVAEQLVAFSRLADEAQESLGKKLTYGPEEGAPDDQTPDTPIANIILP